MTRALGLERNEQDMRAALSTILAIERAANGEPALLNMTAAAKLIAAAALERRESRGAHFRTDYPRTEKVGVRSRFTLAEANRIASDLAEAEPACARR